MSAIQVFWPYLRGQRHRFVLLLITMLIRPVLGGIGFTLLVPLLSLLELPDEPVGNSRLAKLASFLPAEISLTLYNTIGQHIATVLNQTHMTTGEYHVNFAVFPYASGIYFCRLVANGRVSTEKIMIIK